MWQIIFNPIVSCNHGESIANRMTMIGLKIILIGIYRTNFIVYRLGQSEIRKRSAKGFLRIP